MSLGKVILVGLEPTIPGSVGRRLIHWATGPVLEPSLKLKDVTVIWRLFKACS